jgi:peptide/nickel transport system ATP-binding protein
MESLLSAVPLIDPEGEQKKIRLKGEIPSASEQISGCPFHTRCPRFLGDICVEKQPPWRKDPQTKKWIYCHIKIDDLTAQQSRTFRFSNRTAEET